MNTEDYPIMREEMESLPVYIHSVNGDGITREREILGLVPSAGAILKDNKPALSGGDIDLRHVSFCHIKSWLDRCSKYPFAWEFWQSRHPCHIPATVGCRGYLQQPDHSHKSWLL